MTWILIIIAGIIICVGADKFGQPLIDNSQQNKIEHRQINKKTKTN